MQAGKYEKAISVLARNGWWDRLCGIVRTLDATRDAGYLQLCATAFRRAGQSQFAKETYVKLGDQQVDISTVSQSFCLIRY